MPRGKSYRRSQAARRRKAERHREVVSPKSAPRHPVAGHGTGWRHRVRAWPTSVHTGRQHKLVIPAEVPGKRFVLLVGASHLRSFADGIVAMPKDLYSFGVMSTPGGCADQLRTEVEHAVLPRTPDAVCVLAPSNNLTASINPERAGEPFGRYLASVCSAWPTAQVFAVDLVPRLTVPEDIQEFFRQEFHRVAARLGVKYYHHGDRFPLADRWLWCRDGLHLSDDMGTPLLMESLLDATTQHLETATPEVPCQVSPTPRRRRPARVVVVGEVRAPRPPPSEWTRVAPGRKANGAPLVLRECFIPLNPVWFSPGVLAAMETPVPSPVDAVSTGSKPLPVEHRREAVSPKRKRPRKEVCNVLIQMETVEQEATPVPVSTCGLRAEADRPAAVPAPPAAVPPPPAAVPPPPAAVPPPTAAVPAPPAAVPAPPAANKERSQECDVQYKV
ncbi:hypothetical protein PAMA_018881 [Pampus argenteus]